ncbi:ADP-ribosylglycohydrolase family protein [Granulicoccus phenolivorans]|uniref:ADP-ribosylglycohydrolase family protein n=1 Tax=Granulicoccus phenolivorans TaxID=266854 RepID=UPI00042A1E8C|nr:ADP-ribosylglycohydrolase family protein [Granulicoccus phenolivorans]
MAEDPFDPRDTGDEPDYPPAYPEAFSNAYRGMLLGLLLGDVRDPTQRVLQSGPAVQQTCLTVDALIRYEAWLGNDSGARDPMPEVSSAVLRWAAMQGLVKRPDLLSGWVSRVTVLNAPRGQDRPSEQALPGLTVGRQWAANEDTSSVPLLRCLPLAGTAIVAGPAEVSQWCALSAALTHGNADALISTSFLGVMVGAHLTSVFREGAQELDPATATSWLMREHPGCELIDRVISVLADSEPWSAQRLAELSPDPSAGSVLIGALYLHRHFRGQSPSALRPRTRSAGDPYAVAALTGALLGLERGVDVLDVDELTRHELTWPMDTLARDYCSLMWVIPSEFGSPDSYEQIRERYPTQ